MNHLSCYRCNTTYSLDKAIWKCDCGGLLDIEFQPAFDLDKISRRKPTMWRYREAIPITDDTNIVSFDEGFTPLTEIGFHGKSVFIKQDHLFPTGSYKDRGASVLISKAKELGVGKVVEDSSGNAGCAIAAYCAKARIRCDIFVPERTASGKVAQIQLNGARLNRIPGTREHTAEAVLKAAEKDYYASHSWNPFFFHGTKTFAFEICEQLGWKTPNSVVLPAGNGTLLLGSAIGFAELFNAGVIDSVPKIIAVQAAQCAPLYTTFEEKAEILPDVETGETIAEGIAIAKPIRWRQIVDAVRQSHGFFVKVDESEIEKSLRDVCEKGFYIEPTSAATIAGLSKYLDTSGPDEVVVSVFTGHGLKTTEKMLALLDR